MACREYVRTEQGMGEQETGVRCGARLSPLSTVDAHNMLYPAGVPCDIMTCSPEMFPILG